MIIRIPFDGFHESLYARAIDEYCEFEGIETFKVDWGKVARDYLWYWCLEAGVKAEFVELRHPREYNFDTDAIYAELNPLPLLPRICRKALSEHVYDRLRRREGFFPFYSNDLNDWGDANTWDANQWAVVLEVLQGDVSESHCDYWQGNSGPYECITPKDSDGYNGAGWTIILEYDDGSGFTFPTSTPSLKAAMREALKDAETDELGVRGIIRGECVIERWCYSLDTPSTNDWEK